MGICKLLAGATVTSIKKMKVVLYLWAINVVFALFALLPLCYLIDKNMSHSLMGDTLMGGVDHLWLGDMIYKVFHTGGGVLVAMLFAPLPAYLLLHIFLNGGIIGRLINRDAKVTLSRFFADCGAYFGRFFRLFLLSIPAYLLSAALLYGMLSLIFGRFTRQAVTEWPRIIAGNSKIVLFLLVFSWVNMFFDYVKIRLVAADSRKICKATWFTAKLVAKRLFTAWGIYVLVGIANILFGVVFLEISNLLGSATLWMVLLGFIWQQVFIFGRMFLRLSLLSAQVKLYTQCCPRAAHQL